MGEANTPPGGAGTPTDVAQWVAASEVADRITALGEGFSDAAKDAAGRAAIQAQRLLEVENAGEVLAQVVNRYRRAGAEQFMGRIFEWHQEATFTVNAHSPLMRGVMTEFPQVPGLPSDPHSPVDVGVVGPDGSWLVEAQAKVLAGTSQRLHELA